MKKDIEKRKNGKKGREKKGEKKGKRTKKKGKKENEKKLKDLTFESIEYEISKKGKNEKLLK